MKNKIGYIIIVSIISMLLGVASGSAKPKKDGEAKIKFTETVYDFGNISESCGKVSHDFEFANIGDGPLIITEATAECGCTRPEYPKNPIASGKKGKVKVVFLPAGRRGSFEKTVTVKTNGNPRKARVKIKGVVIPK